MPPVLLFRLTSRDRVERTRSKSCPAPKVIDETIRGSGFAAGASVTFANIAATNVVALDANTLTATIPVTTSAGAARVVVTNANGDSGSLTGAFRYVSPFDPDGCGGMRRRVGSRS
jgi:hypothetical protein